jgi:ribosomal protein L37AE/L43A
MTPHTETAARTRLITFGKNICPQCGAHLLAPDWSEHVSERCIRHTWSCEACAYEFETAVYFPSFEESASAQW